MSQISLEILSTSSAGNRNIDVAENETNRVQENTMRPEQGNWSELRQHETPV